MRYQPTVWCIYAAFLLPVVAADQAIRSLCDRAWIVYNAVDGIYEADFFTIYTFDYKAYDVYIDDHRIKTDRASRSDKDTEDMVQYIAHQRNRIGAYISQYSAPRKLWTPGEHSFDLYLSRIGGVNRSSSNVIHIHATLQCHAIPLLFLPPDTVPTCVCHILPESIVQR